MGFSLIHVFESELAINVWPNEAWRIYRRTEIFKMIQTSLKINQRKKERNKVGEFSRKVNKAKLHNNEQQKRFEHKEKKRGEQSGAESENAERKKLTIISSKPVCSALCSNKEELSLANKNCIKSFKLLVSSPLLLFTLLPSFFFHLNTPLFIVYNYYCSHNNEEK